MNKGKAIVIVGLPGSNKSIFARRNHPRMPLFANISGSGDLPLLEAALERGEDCVVTDHLMCLAGMRDTLENRLNKFGYAVEWKFLANEPALCLENCRNFYPADKLSQVESFIRLQGRDYSIPDGSIIYPIPT